MPESQPGAPEPAALAAIEPVATLFPDVGAAASDEAPTIISRKKPARDGLSGSSSEAIISGSLRGRTLAHFELIEPIGVGGMAAVIRARDKHLDRLVALKILPPEMASDDENVRRFHQEARAAAELDHENIARVFFCGEDQRLHFIAFEFVEGLNLRALLERRGRLPVPEAVHYMLQIATGLAHAASRGVVHRDIKPSNIIITPNGRAKLVDMGLARNMGPQTDKDLTQSGVTLGTFDYIAPEQAMDPRDADVRSDIYALGCTFYHMLTGQPPVPEGTAAKKLHHHQHVAPVDPRQLNPDISDDVATILARMMAKDPKDRYQRAEHLVQHLIQIAQKLGAVADLPDGVLFVDAPLPTPPRKRPLLMAALAALGLGIVLIVLSFAPGRSDVRPARNPETRAEVKPPAAQQLPISPDLKKDGTPAPGQQGPRRIATEQELRDALADKAGPVHLILDRTIPISEAGLAFQGKADRTLLIESKGKDPKNPMTLRITPNRTAEVNAPWIGLELNAGTVTFRNVCFEIDADKTPAGMLAGVLVRGARLVTFEGCTFTQPKVPMPPLIQRPHLTPVASVAAWNAGEDEMDKPRLVFKECYFQRGQTAVALITAADVSLTSCAFGDHAALFHLRGQGKAGLRSSLELTNVSAFLVHGPAFRLDNAAACNLKVTHCLFSCPDGLLDQRDPPDLIRQTNTRLPTVHYQGRSNCYHNLNAFWVRSEAKGPPLTIANFDSFKVAIKGDEGTDEASHYLTASSPWDSANPLTEEPSVAFKIKTNLPELRRDDQSLKAIGVEKCTWGTSNEGLPKSPPQPEVPVVKLKPNEKIVDPATDGNTAGVYSTIQAAVADAKAGDVVVLIRHTGLLSVVPIALKGDQRVTVRPYAEHRPILTLAEKTAESDAALFTLHHGKLCFESLEFHLKPNREDFKSQTVVALAGNGLCSFKQCVVTLELPDGWQVPLSAVALVESRDAMKMAPADGRSPEIRLQRCFVRGEGDLLTARPSRPFLLDVDSALIALSGSLLSADGGPEEPTAGPAVAQVKLTRVTAFLGEHLIGLRTRNGKGTVFTQVTAAACLFAAAANKALIYLDGPDGAEQMKKVFGWEGKRNAYSGFDKLLEQQSAGEMVVTLKYDRETWQNFANEEPKARFVQVKFEAPPLTERALSQATPDDFRGKAEPRVDLQGSGASVGELPRPATRAPAAAEGSTGDE